MNQPPRRCVQAPEAARCRRRGRPGIEVWRLSRTQLAGSCPRDRTCIRGRCMHLQMEVLSPSRRMQQRKKNSCRPGRSVDDEKRACCIAGRAAQRAGQRARCRRAAEAAVRPLLPLLLPLPRAQAPLANAACRNPDPATKQQASIEVRCRRHYHMTRRMQGDSVAMGRVKSIHCCRVHQLIGRITQSGKIERRTGAGLDEVLQLHDHHRHVVAAVAVPAVGAHRPWRRLHLHHDRHDAQQTTHCGLLGARMCRKIRADVGSTRSQMEPAAVHSSTQLTGWHLAASSLLSCNLHLAFDEPRYADELLERSLCLPGC